MVKRDITHLKSEPVAEPSSTEEPPKWAGMKYDPSTGEFERPSAPQTSAEGTDVNRLLDELVMEAVSSANDMNDDLDSAEISLKIEDIRKQIVRLCTQAHKEETHGNQED